jgi:GNAT superfamily N-acetyltransferase
MGDVAKPDLSTDDVVFGEATPHQRILAWRLNGASWAPPMALDEYVGREQSLSETALSANGGTRYWVLHRKGDPEYIVSACETTAKKALVADARGRRVVDAYSIASVFTNPLCRGRGLAAFMLEKIKQIVDEDTDCGALYSDIGKAYYARLGWPAFPSPQVTLHLEEGVRLDRLPTRGASLLAERDVAALCEKDIEALEQKFDGLARDNDGKTHITFLPSFAQCSWHFARDAYVCRAMRRREAEHRGAVTADGSSWLYWDHDLREKKLKIQRIVTRGSDPPEKKAGDVKALLLAALSEAEDWGIVQVLAWSPTQEVTAAVMAIWHEVGEGLQVSFDHRTKMSLPSLRWKGGKDVGEVVWQDNEYFSWC